MTVLLFSTYYCTGLNLLLYSDQKQSDVFTKTTPTCFQYQYCDEEDLYILTMNAVTGSVDTEYKSLEHSSTTSTHESTIISCMSSTPNSNHKKVHWGNFKQRWIFLRYEAWKSRHSSTIFIIYKHNWPPVCDTWSMIHCPLILVMRSRESFIAHYIIQAIAMKPLGCWIASVISVLLLMEKSVAGEICVIPLLFHKHDSLHATECTFEYTQQPPSTTIDDCNPYMKQQSSELSL